MGKISHADIGANLTKSDWESDNTHKIGGVTGLNIARFATYIVAANDAPSSVRAMADSTCDGTADDVQIQAAINALTSSRTRVEKVVLIGSFTADNSSTPITIPSYTIFELQGKITATDKTKDLIVIQDGADDGASDVFLIGGHYDGASGATYSSDNVAVIRVSGASANPPRNVHIWKPRVTNAYSRGITTAYADGVYITDPDIDTANEPLMLWLNVADLATFTGFVSVKGGRINNSNSNAIDGTIGDGVIDGVRILSDKAIAIDGFKNLTYANIITAGSVNALQGAYDSVTGSKVNYVNIHAANVIEIRNNDDTDLDKVNIVNTDAVNGINVIITGAGDINEINIANHESDGASQAGVYTNSTSTGRIQKLIINGASCLNSTHRGLEIRYANYVCANGIIAENNADVGAGFYNCNKVILNGYQAIKGTAQGYVAEFDTVDIAYLDNIWAEQQTTGGFVFTTVTKRVIGDINGYYLFKNSGTSNIASGATTKVIAHGLAETPTLDQIAILFGEQGSNDYGRWWVDTIGAANFTLNVSADPGASNLDFGWKIHIDK